MGRRKLPESERKVRVVIYAKADHVRKARAVAEDRGLDLSQFTDRVYAKTEKFHRTEKAVTLDT